MNAADMTDAELLRGAQQFSFVINGERVMIAHTGFLNIRPVRGWQAWQGEHGLVDSARPKKTWHGDPEFESGWCYKAATEFETVRDAIAAVQAAGRLRKAATV